MAERHEPRTSRKRVYRTEEPFVYICANILIIDSNADSPRSIDMFRVSDAYDYSKSTAENYSRLHMTQSKSNERLSTILQNLAGAKEESGSYDHHPHVGDYAEIRKTRDYSYHPIYSHKRQLLQDRLIRDVVCGSREPLADPWIIFTAGAMGAGKSFSLNWMSQNGFFPLEDLSVLDPDEFKKSLPEWQGYVNANPLSAGALTHLESGFLVEIAQEALLQRKSNIQVDGSLRDWRWYQNVFKAIKKQYPSYHIAIMYIYAEKKVVYERVKKRAKITGREVPLETLNASIEQVPLSVQKLREHCDFVAYVDNSDTPRLTRLYDKEHPGGYDNPCWSQVKGLFPVHSELLERTASHEVERLLESKEPILFSKSYCTWCDRAKELLRLLGVRYQVCEINNFHPTELTFLMQTTLKNISGTHRVPQLYFKKSFIGNFEQLKELYLSEEVLNLLPTKCVKGSMPKLNF